jgi:NTE family protein
MLQRFRDHSAAARLRTMMAQADSRASWIRAAHELDILEGNDAWREKDDSDWFNAALLRENVQELDRLRATGDPLALEALLTESVYRHLSDISSPSLYEQTHTGETRRVIGDWLEACVRAIEWLRDADTPGLSRALRRERFIRADANFGDTGLLLSGGGAWGLYHLGVVKALSQAALLPEVICGSSMGAIIAAGVCTRTAQELNALFTNPASIHRTAVQLLNPLGMMREKTLLSPHQLREHVEANVGMYTFREAWERTGRVLNVSISPTRARQKPRVLSYRTAPDVLIADATVASCSIPGLFPPVTLRARNMRGEIVPYVPTEKWVDGSMRGDLPMQRLARLHNVNHFIVSQANPFVLPFVVHRHHGPLRRGTRLMGALVRAQMAAVLDETRQRFHSDTIRPWLDTAHALTGQHYGGDITIHPRVPPAKYAQVMANPTLHELHQYILDGERATWPRLPVIRDQTHISRSLKDAVHVLRDT